MRISSIPEAPLVVRNRMLLLNPERPPVRIKHADGSIQDDWFGCQRLEHFHREELIRLSIRQLQGYIEGGTLTTARITNELSRLRPFVKWDGEWNPAVEKLQKDGLRWELLRLFGLEDGSRGRWQVIIEERLISVGGTDWFIVDDLRTTGTLAEDYGAEAILVHDSGLRLVRKDAVAEDAPLIEFDERVKASLRAPTPDSWVIFLVQQSGDWGDIPDNQDARLKFYRGAYDSEDVLRHDPGPARFQDDRVYRENPDEALWFHAGNEDEAVSLWIRYSIDPEEEENPRPQLNDIGLAKRGADGLVFKVTTPTSLGMNVDQEEVESRLVRDGARRVLKNALLRDSERAFRCLARRSGIGGEFDLTHVGRLGIPGSSVESQYSDFFWVKFTGYSDIADAVQQRILELNWWS